MNFKCMKFVSARITVLYAYEFCTRENTEKEKEEWKKMDLATTLYGNLAWI